MLPSLLLTILNNWNYFVHPRLEKQTRFLTQISELLQREITILISTKDVPTKSPQIK